MRYYIYVWKATKKWVASESSIVDVHGYDDINRAYRDRARAADLNHKVKNNRYIVIEEGQLISRLGSPT